MPEDLTDVIFRADRAGPHKGSITAIFPAYPGTNQYDALCYAHVGQHSSCSYEWYRYNTRPATAAEYADLKRELESLSPEPYRLRVVKRWTREHAEARRAACRRSVA